MGCQSSRQAQSPAASSLHQVEEETINPRRRRGRSGRKPSIDIRRATKKKRNIRSFSKQSQRNIQVEPRKVLQKSSPPIQLPPAQTQVSGESSPSALGGREPHVIAEVWDTVFRGETEFLWNAFHELSKVNEKELRSAEAKFLENNWSKGFSSVYKRLEFLSTILRLYKYYFTGSEANDNHPTFATEVITSPALLRWWKAYVEEMSFRYKRMMQSERMQMLVDQFLQEFSYPPELIVNVKWVVIQKLRELFEKWINTVSVNTDKTFSLSIVLGGGPEDQQDFLNRYMRRSFLSGMLLMFTEVLQFIRIQPEIVAWQKKKILERQESSGNVLYFPPNELKNPTHSYDDWEYSNLSCNSGHGVVPGSGTNNWVEMDSPLPEMSYRHDVFYPIANENLDGYNDTSRSYGGVKKAESDPVFGKTALTLNLQDDSITQDWADNLPSPHGVKRIEKNHNRKAGSSMQAPTSRHVRCGSGSIVLQDQPSDDHSMFTLLRNLSSLSPTSSVLRRMYTMPKKSRETLNVPQFSRETTPASSLMNCEGFQEILDITDPYHDVKKVSHQRQRRLSEVSLQSNTSYNLLSPQGEKTVPLGEIILPVFAQKNSLETELFKFGSAVELFVEP